MLDSRLARPSRQLAPFVKRLVGYRYEGMEPGQHRGLPSCQLTVVLSLGAPTRVTNMPDPRQTAADFPTLVGGLHTRPAMISHDGSQYGLQLDLTPAGSRALLGVPAAELGPAVVELSELLGGAGDEIVERCQGAPGWATRFAILEEVLTRRIATRRALPPRLEHAWNRIMVSEGTVRIARVAGEIGWSRRHLAQRFLGEFGVTPKQAARLARFQRSHRRLRRASRATTLADVAAASGYYDQAHMAREWNEMAGCPPSEWLISEQLPFVQDRVLQGGED